MVSRKKLYRQVWAAPMLKVAARYGVSSTYLARICQRMNVPMPGRGYWAKHAVGKAPPPIALPEPRPGDLMVWQRAGESDEPGSLPDVLRAAKVPRRRRKKSERPDRHELVIDVRAHFVGGRVTRSGYLRPYKKRLVDIFVSDHELDRTLDVANALFLTLEDRGHRVRLAPEGDVRYRRDEVREREDGGESDWQERWCPSRPTLVFVGAVAFALTIFEISEDAEVRLVDGRLVRASEAPPPRHAMFKWSARRQMPTGRLCVRAASPYWQANWEKTWSEKAPGDIPKLFDAIARTLEAEASTLVGLVTEGEREEALRRVKLEEEDERRRKEEAEQRRVANIEAARVDLMEAIAAWDEVRRIHDFFDDAERRIADLDEPRRSALQEQLRLAREVVGHVDGLAMLDGWIPPQRRG